MRRALPAKNEVLADPTLLTTLLEEGAATAATLEEAHTADAMTSDVGEALQLLPLGSGL
jgi:hypothetical protein